MATRDPTDSPATGFTRVGIAYAVAGAVALFVGTQLSGRQPIVVALAADLAATVVVFGFSVWADNSSLYDPYWSVAPPAIAMFFALSPGSEYAVRARRMLVIALVTLWAVRLTWNWARGWGGLAHEDWRYVDLRTQTGAYYWPVSLLGLHGFPTLQVFLGCLPLWPALHAGEHPFGVLDVVAAVITTAAIAIEAIADAQLHAFRVGAPPGSTLDTGLWAWSRHPNYFGEVTFWWGLFAFGLAADPTAWWSGCGALAITTMFVFVSVPLLDRRMLARRPDYAARMATVSALVPLPRRRPPGGGAR